MTLDKEQRRLIFPPDVNIWPHEMETAKALVAAGYMLSFIRKSEQEFHTSADVYINGIAWEMKAPKSAYIQRVEGNLREALRQSSYVIFDSRRMKRIPDKAIERELRKCSKELRKLKRLIFVNKHGQVFDIK